MSERTYRCNKCGQESAHTAELRAMPTCPRCGSFDLESLRAAEGRTVPLRVLLSAEQQTLHYKRQYEGLTRIVNEAIKTGALTEPLAEAAQRVMAGRA